MTSSISARPVDRLVRAALVALAIAIVAGSLRGPVAASHDAASCGTTNAVVAMSSSETARDLLVRSQAGGATVEADDPVPDERALAASGIAALATGRGRPGRFRIAGDWNGGIGGSRPDRPPRA